MGKLIMNRHKACGCNDRINSALASHNAELMCNMIDPAVVFVLTDKLDSQVRGAPPKVAATYCPFCGVKYFDQVELI